MSQITTRFAAQQDELTIEVSGPFNFDDIATFRAAYEELQQPPQQIVVDMRQVEGIDSAVLGMLLSMQRKLGLARGAIRIVNAPADVRRILDITHLDKKFTIE
jgi:anti-anti-sigma factor